MTAFLTIFRRFPTTFRRFSKIVPKARRTFPNIFQRLPKTCEEDPKMFRSYTNAFKYTLRDKLDISEIIDIFNSEDMEYATRVPDVLSYEFYEWCIFQ